MLRRFSGGRDVQDFRLTGREGEVAELLVRRWANKEIADQLVVSERTVETHVAHILTKLGVGNRRDVRSRLADVINQ